MANIDFKIVPYSDPPPACSSGERKFLIDTQEYGWFIFDERAGDPSVEQFFSQEVPWITGDFGILTEIGVIIMRRGWPVDPQGNPAKLIIGITKGNPPVNPHVTTEFIHYGEIYPDDLPKDMESYWVYGSFPGVNIENTSAFITITTNTAMPAGTDNCYVWWAQADMCNASFPCALMWDDNSPPWHDTVPYFSRMCFYNCMQQTQYPPPTAYIDTPANGATIPNPVYFEGHGVSNADGEITNYAWLDGNSSISSQRLFTISLSLGTHNISFAVYCTKGGWSPYTTITITVVAPPVCTEGDQKCVGYDLYECQGGTWVLIEQNSSQCGYPEDCPDYTNQSSCEAAGCYWYDGGCHSSPPSEECRSYTTQATCEAAGCYWYNNSCHSIAPSECEAIGTQAECEAAGCYWYSYPNPFGEPSCHDKQWYESYMPYIIMGAGGILILAALLSRAAPMPYYPPQYYYPPPPPSHYPPPK